MEIFNKNQPSFLSKNKPFVAIKQQVKLQLKCGQADFGKIHQIALLITIDTECTQKVNKIR